MLGTTYSQGSPRDRIVSGLLTATMLGAVGAGLLLGLAGNRIVARVADPLTLITIPTPPPPPQVTERIPSKAPAGRASPRNLRNKATPVAAPPPVVPAAPPPPIVVAPRPAVGAAAQSGASDRPGPGQGAGGQGDGFGAGGEGDGDGAGYTPPFQVRGRLKNSDLPKWVVHDQDADGTIAVVPVRYRVAVDGRVDRCTVTRPSGKPVVDALTCRLITERFRFKPSLDPAGRPVVSTIEETHSWGVIHEDEPDERR